MIEHIKKFVVKNVIMSSMCSIMIIGKKINPVYECRRVT